MTRFRHRCVVTCSLNFRLAFPASLLTLLSLVRNLLTRRSLCVWHETCLIHCVRRPDTAVTIFQRMNPQKCYWRLDFAMFHLDYLSCLLTVLATILVGRKLWTGLVVSGVNSAIVCSSDCTPFNSALFRRIGFASASTRSAFGPGSRNGQTQRRMKNRRRDTTRSKPVLSFHFCRAAYPQPDVSCCKLAQLATSFSDLHHI